jgi:hypothetical protein
LKNSKAEPDFPFLDTLCTLYFQELVAVLTPWNVVPENDLTFLRMFSGCSKRLMQLRFTRGLLLLLLIVSINDTL